MTIITKAVPGVIQIMKTILGEEIIQIIIINQIIGLIMTIKKTKVKIIPITRIMEVKIEVKVDLMIGETEEDRMVEEEGVVEVEVEEEIGEDFKEMIIKRILIMKIMIIMILGQIIIILLLIIMKIIIGVLLMIMKEVEVRIKEIILDGNFFNLIIINHIDY